MILRLSVLPDTLRGPDDADYKGRVPKRARFLEPVAAESELRLVARYPWLSFTDIFRSPEASLSALRSKRGVQPPGFSGHNFGGSVDLDLGPCLREGKLTYAELTEVMASGGWYSHRRDLDGTAPESWHFNALGDYAAGLLALADPQQPRTWSRPIEAWITEHYGDSFAYGDHELQRKLTKLRFYSGEVDGKIGPLSREAVAAFQRAWGLPVSVADARTRRVLALVAAEVEIVPLLGSPVG